MHARHSLLHRSETDLQCLQWFAHSLQEHPGYTPNISLLPLFFYILCKEQNATPFSSMVCALFVQNGGGVRVPPLSYASPLHNESRAEIFLGEGFLQASALLRRYAQNQRFVRTHFRGKLACGLTQIFSGSQIPHTRRNMFRIPDPRPSHGDFRFHRPSIALSSTNKAESHEYPV